MLEQVTQAMGTPGIWGWAATVGVGLTLTVCSISILFEILSIIFMFTPSEKDDIWLAKLEKQWLKIKPFLEWFHVKTPMMLVLGKVLERVKKIKKTLEAAKKKKKERIENK
jgi:hypothetical protein